MRFGTVCVRQYGAITVCGIRLTPCQFQTLREVFYLKQFRSYLFKQIRWMIGVVPSTTIHFPLRPILVSREFSISLRRVWV